MITHYKMTIKTQDCGFMLYLSQNGWKWNLLETTGRLFDRTNPYTEVYEKCFYTRFCYPEKLMDRIMGLYYKIVKTSYVLQKKTKELKGLK